MSSLSVREVEILAKIAPRVGHKQFSFPFPEKPTNKRLLERLAHFNQLHVYMRDCDATGKRILSMFSPDVKFPVYDNEFWWGDSWDPTSYGTPFDFGRPFFAQLEELRDEVPQLARSVTANENSQFCNNATHNKNAYLIFNTSYSENCMYSENVCRCDGCIDCTQCRNCQYCYECILCNDSYELKYSENCESCSHSAFLLNCRSCQNCFGCSNLYRREYCIFNKQYSKTSYQEFMKGLDLSSYAQIKKLRAVVDEKLGLAPRPHIISRRAQEVSGNIIENARDADNSYLIFGGEGLYNCFNLDAPVKNCLDYSAFGHGAELIYQSVRCGLNIYNLAFCLYCVDACQNLFYCISCRQSENCFGCVGLKRRKYCIFNKQYTKEEYFALLPRIIAHMQRTGEWGQFYPTKMSAIPYNHSMACRYLQLRKEKVISAGLSWADSSTIDKGSANSAIELPDKLPDTNSPMMVKSVVTGKPFLITSHEIKKYSSVGLPLPRETYDERLHRRARRLGGVNLLNRKCDKTDIPLLSVYGNDSTFPVWERNTYEKEFFS